MKKFICALLAVLMLPLFALAADYPEESYLGAWTQVWKSGVTSRRVSTILLEEKGRAFYIVENLSDDNSAEVDVKVLTWSVDGHVLTFRQEDGTENKLYRLNDFQLSVDDAGIYQLFFNRVYYSDLEYDSVANPTPAPSPVPVNLDPCGKWTYYTGATDLNKVVITHDTGVLSFDLFFFADGSVYLTQGYMKKNKLNYFLENLSGIWIGDHADMTFKISDGSYKAWITDDGIMHVRFPSGSVYLFTRVEKGEIEK